MGSILKRLFQGDIIFPQSPEQEKDFSDLADDIQKKRRHMETSLGPEEAQAAGEYLELLERFHHWERLLCYENGFLLATALWLEVWDRMGRSEL